MPYVPAPRSTGIPWVDALLRAAVSDPTGGLAPAPGLAQVGGRFVSPLAREFLRQAAAEAPDRYRAAAGWLRALRSPATELPLSNFSSYSQVASDTNAPSLLASELLQPGGGQHYLNLLNRLFRTRSTVASDPLQSGAYELLLLKYLGRGKL